MPRSIGEIADIAAMIADTRIGSSFWAAPSPDLAIDVLLRPRSMNEVQFLLDRWKSGTIVLPQPFAQRHFVRPCRMIAGEHDPWSLIENAARIVASIDDEIGLLAAATGRVVIDPDTQQPIAQEHALKALGKALDAFDYVDPFTGKPIDVAAWIGILGDWRKQIDVNRQIASILGIARWKRAAIRSFLWAPDVAKLQRVVAPEKIPAGKTIAIWPSRVSPDVTRRAAAAHVPVARIEDGFVRSIGLGAMLHPPRSIVVDLEGIYYDPQTPSTLERILAETTFDVALLKRASALVRAITGGGITKYGSGAGAPVRFPTGKRLVLVPGQVEDDMSVRLGGAGVSGNLDLLRRVRDAEPTAFIAYKPHPDVASGLRKGHVPLRAALDHVDIVLPRSDIAVLLDRVDAVHVLSSLTGFEALLRSREVIVHGQPFYAGWGLTRDLAPPIARRRRKLTLDELAAGALILYPRYLDPETGLPCPPEILVQRYAGVKRPNHRVTGDFRALLGKVLIAARTMQGAVA